MYSLTSANRYYLYQGFVRLTEMVVPLLKVIVIPERLNSSSDNMTRAI